MVYELVKEYVVQQAKCYGENIYVSQVQRKFRLSYPKAVEVINRLVSDGLLKKGDVGKGWEVILPESQS